jgi:hypothetical protein
MDRTLSRRVALGAVVVAGLVVGPMAYMKAETREFPPDTTPEGAYLRLVVAVRDDRVADAFAYLETEAQWACLSAHDYRKRARALVEQHYPEPERSTLLARHRAVAEASGGPEAFAREAAARGWVARLRRDLAGIGAVEVHGERATVVTARGTRYPFRRRDNGIWGLTLFTGELQAEAQRAARDFGVVEKAAADYRAAAPAASR